MTNTQAKQTHSSSPNNGARLNALNALFRAFKLLWPKLTIWESEDAVRDTMAIWGRMLSTLPVDVMISAADSVIAEHEYTSLPSPQKILNLGQRIKRERRAAELLRQTESQLASFKVVDALTTSDSELRNYGASSWSDLIKRVNGGQLSIPRRTDICDDCPPIVRQDANGWRHSPVDPATGRYLCADGRLGAVAKHKIHREKWKQYASRWKESQASNYCS